MCKLLNLALCLMLLSAPLCQGADLQALRDDCVGFYTLDDSSNADSTQRVCSAFIGVDGMYFEDVAVNATAGVVGQANNFPSGSTRNIYFAKYGYTNKTSITLTATSPAISAAETIAHQGITRDSSGNWYTATYGTITVGGSDYVVVITKWDSSWVWQADWKKNTADINTAFGTSGKNWRASDCQILDDDSSDEKLYVCFKSAELDNGMALFDLSLNLEDFNGPATQNDWTDIANGASIEDIHLQGANTYWIITDHTNGSDVYVYNRTGGTDNDWAYASAVHNLQDRDGNDRGYGGFDWISATEILCNRSGDDGISDVYYWDGSDFTWARRMPSLAKEGYHRDGNTIWLCRGDLTDDVDIVKYDLNLSASHPLDTEARAISFWMRTSDKSNNYIIFASPYDPASDANNTSCDLPPAEWTYDYSIISKAGFIVLTRGAVGNNSRKTPSQVIASNDTWYHVVVMDDESGALTNIKIFINGAEVGSLIADTTNWWTWGGTYEIGARQNNAITFIGDIDQVAFFNRRLTDDEVELLYNKSFPYMGMGVSRVIGAGCW